MDATPLKANQPIKAGFPNAALDAPNYSLDLNQLLVKNPASTFFMRVEGHSMEKMNIYSNDLLIIDRSLQIQPGDLIVAYSEGEFVLHRINTQDPSTSSDSIDMEYFGVITHIVHSAKL